MSSPDPTRSLDDVAVAGPRDAGNWAQLVSHLHVGHELPPEAVNLNVEGRRLSGPTHGFGKLWRKTYRIDLGSHVSPQEIVATWKSDFPKFWPRKSWFYGPVTGVAPGGVGLINITIPGHLKVSTGVLVLYADDESFTFITPEGHQYAGLITFSAYERDGGSVAQVEALIRASDPLWELGMPLAINRIEDRFWKRTLTSLAQHFGATAEVHMDVLCVDSRRQWPRWSNIKHNALVRSGVHALGAPVRALRNLPARRS